MSIISEVKEHLLLDSKYKIVENGQVFDIRHTLVHGHNINYAQAGTGPALVLIHGWTGAWNGWMRIAKYLRKHFTLYIVDLPGFGDSDRLRSYTIKNEAKMVQGFISALNLKPAAIIGHSMGTFIAAQIAKTSPSITKNLILISPVFSVRPSQKISNMLTSEFFESIENKPLLEKLTKDILDTKLLSFTIAKAFGMKHFDRDLIAGENMFSRKRTAKEALSELYVESVRSDLIKLLKGTKMPVLLIHGDSDRISGQKDARKALKNTKNKITYKQIPDAGHLVIQEKPKLCAQAILNFLN